MTTSKPLEIELYPPQLVGQRAEFSWAESQPSGIYKKNNFYLEFPASVPLERVPMSLWWTVFLLCVHSHWTLLRPCRIRLPLRLGDGEALLLTKPKTTPKVWEDCDVSPRNSGKIRKDNGVGKSVVFCIHEGTDERRVRHDGHGNGVVLRDGPHRVPSANTRQE